MRRGVMVVIVLAAVLLAPTLAFAGGGKEGKPAEKVTVRVLGLTDPGISAEGKLSKEFTQSTESRLSTRPTSGAASWRR